MYKILSIIIIIITMIPFFLQFEKSKPKVRDIMMVAVIVAIAVASRAAFFMVPQVKPIIAIVIIGGIALGPSSGFMIGALSAFVSNFIFGQGPWTVWQMFGMGVIGLISGLLAKKLEIIEKPVINIKIEKSREENIDRRNNLLVALYGFLITFFIYGFFVDLWTIFGVTESPNIKAAITIYIAALPFNLILAASTFIFLLLLKNPMLRKINRIKSKYGMR
ncbi:MAG: ECF transporter S component [Anaerovoracaceae bacterium]